MNARTQRSRLAAAARRGMSMMEVMFSIGVAFIGLLGVAALIPLAANQLGQATRADQGSAFGRAAINDLQVRGLHRPSVWTMRTGNTFTPVSTLIQNGAGVRFGDSFCLDPNYLGRLGTLNPPPTFPDPRVNYFPAVAAGPNDARMWRISAQGMSAIFNSSGNYNGPGMLDEIFVRRDDLVFTRPEDETLPPEQMFSFNLQNRPDKRQHQGDLSWMATFSPQIDINDVLRMGGFPTSPQNRGAFGGADLQRSYDQQNVYIMSLIVFNKRPDPLESSDRVVNVSLMYSEGVAGGDMVFESPVEDALEIRSGDWVMLGCKISNPNSANPGDWPAVFRWYRVVSADREAVYDANRDMFQKEVFLDGADWYRHEPLAFGAQQIVGPTQATILSGVVAVFEKTIRLEGTSP